MAHQVHSSHVQRGAGPVASISVQPLGAGQDVGRSCIIAKFHNQTGAVLAMVMLDCGLHVGYDDDGNAFPQFDKVKLKTLDAVLVTHYHIDHCGALPMLTERAQYKGLILVTPPTKALLAMMLEDQLASRNFTSPEILASVEKCTTLEARQTFTVKPGLEVTGYRAGHVLGAVIFHVKYHNATLIYTGDYNATPDRHLGAFEYCPLPPDSARPDVLITESTYGSTTRGSQRSCEREFLDQVHSCLLRGGKVLVPSFALGRVQEIVSLLESHWDRLNLHFPIYLSTKDAVKVASVYQFYEGWGSSRVPPPGEEQALKTDFATEFSKKYIRMREPTLREMEEPGPMVLLATAGMLAGGLSVRAFRIWAGDDKNAVIFPGHCVQGTLGYTLLAQKEKLAKGESVVLKMTRRPNDEVMVRCAVSTTPFSAHTDSKGILQMVHQLRPHNVILVHGVRIQMEALKRRIERELPFLQDHVYFPHNFDKVDMPLQEDSRVLASVKRAKFATLIPSETFTRRCPLSLDMRTELIVRIQTICLQKGWSNIEIKGTARGITIQAPSSSLDVTTHSGDEIECSLFVDEQTDSTQDVQILRTIVDNILG